MTTNNSDGDLTIFVNDLQNAENIYIGSNGILANGMFAPRDDIIAKFFLSIESLTSIIWEPGYSINTKATLAHLETEIRKGKFARTDKIKSTLLFLKRYSPNVYVILTDFFSKPVEGIYDSITNMIQEDKELNT